MTLDERLKNFQRNVARPTEWDTVHGTTVKLIYDLIDERVALKARIRVLTVAGAAAVMVAEEREEVTEEEARLSKDRVLARYDRT